VFFDCWENTGTVMSNWKIRPTVTKRKGLIRIPVNFFYKLLFNQSYGCIDHVFFIKTDDENSLTKLRSQSECLPGKRFKEINLGFFD
jgi:hypothetical protein